MAFRDDLIIDLDNLHMEWLSHPQNRYDFSVVVRDKEKAVKQKNIQLSVASARIARQLKGDAGTKKPTVNDITNACIEDEICQAIQAQLIELEYERDIAKSALKAWDDRKETLEYEVELWKREYFSTPSEQRPVSAKLKPDLSNPNPDLPIAKKRLRRELANSSRAIEI